jgi:predicted peptidase
MTQTAQGFETTTIRHIRTNYLLYLPPDYDESHRWPLILFLHGAGERGTDIDLIKLHGIPAKLEKGDDLPFIIVAPQCPVDTWWPDIHEAIIELLDNVIGAHVVDTGRIYLTGLSMGGFGTWYLAQKYPQRFAAIAPICGRMPWYIDEARAAQILKTMPVWAFHGAKDEVVPLAEQQLIIDALQASDGNVQFTVYPELEHDSWTVTYDNPDLYSWFLQHRRQRS